MLFPLEANKAHNIDYKNGNGYDIAEDGLHPGLNFQALTRIGFRNKIIPTPTITLAAAENSKHKRTYRKQICGDQEIPEIKPCRTFRKGLEGENAVAKRGGGGGQSKTDTADKRTLGSAPPGEFANAGKNILKHRENGRERSEHHEQEEKRTPDSAGNATHAKEDRGHGIKQQRGTGANLNVISKAGRENNQTGSNSHKRIQANNIDRLAQKATLLADIAAKDCHGTNAKTKRKERLVHSTNNNIRGNFTEIGQKVEFQTFRCAGKRKTVDRENDHQNKKRDHQVLGDTFQTALQIEAKDRKANNHNDEHKHHVEGGIRDHIDKTEVSGIAGKETDEVVNEPAGYAGIEGHQTNITEQGKIAMQMPFLTGFLQFLIHANGTCLGCSAQSKLHNHDGKAKKQQAKNINQDKSAATILTCHPRELPNIAAADSTARAQQDETKSRRQAFTIFHKQQPLY